MIKLETRFVREIVNCLRIHSFVGAATIIAEENLPERFKRLLIRSYAEMAIAAGARLQAEHLLVVRYARMMTQRIRRKFAAMPRA